MGRPRGSQGSIGRVGGEPPGLTEHLLLWAAWQRLLWQAKQGESPLPSLGSPGAPRPNRTRAAIMGCLVTVARAG